MALKIIGAGFGRTGTASLYQALNQLGFPCYHMHEVVFNKENKNHMDFWVEVAEGEAGQQHDWERVFEKYTAAVDFPASCVWRELLEHYPDAKVILTGHPKGPEAWYKSACSTIYATENMWQFKLLALVDPFARKLGKVGKLIWQGTLKGTMEDENRAVAQYNDHLNAVKADVPADKLLDYTVDQGWQPLCDFLGVPVPETEFPNINDAKQFKKNLKKLTFGAYVILGVATLVLIAIIMALL